MAWRGCRTFCSFFLVLLHTCHSDTTVCDHAQMAASSDQLTCSGSEAFFQRGTRIGSEGQAVSMIADTSLEDSKLWTFHGASSAAKLIFPSWKKMFTCVATLAILFTACAFFCRLCRGCTGCLAGLFILLTLALLGLKYYLMHSAGPDPAGPVIQPPVTSELVVDATVPFTTAEINAPGPVNTAYLEAMQTVLDRRSGIPGLHQVESLVASPAAAVLLQQAQAPVEGRLSLAYTFAEQNIKDNAPFMNPALIAADLEGDLREAASNQTGADVPKVLTQIAQGTRSGAADPAAKLKIDFSLQCEATHQLSEDIRAGARIMIRKYQGQAFRKMESAAQKTGLRLADRCNDHTQKEVMQVCLGPEYLWVDFVTREAVTVPAAEDSLQNYVCKLACNVGAALSSEKSKAIKASKSKLQPIGVDENTFSQVQCSPFLSAGQKCNLPCA